ncbi:hypothetical protein CCMSSC00406_0006936 [Pleurotus cornucopiae]|uniref:Uncharacterized protein n=1 Tax=Pleurotus cornucopiae TaxID=5321 RepID=A0ACB7J0A8_PLECO|nr:hypothetical protein CCMSSC00406_0006936 [Pleurotus cornucopiae]
MSSFLSILTPSFCSLGPWGLRASIRAELYRKHLSPDKSSWKKVAFEAEIQEIAENVMGGHSRNPQGTSNMRAASSHVQRTDRGSGSSNRVRFLGRNPQNTRNSEGGTSGPRRDERRNDRSRNWGSNGNQQTSSRSTGNSSRPSQSNYHDQNTPRPVDPRRKYNLSQKEMDDLKTDKKCFYCREPGHVARQCPRAQVMSSSTNRRPPGLRSNNIDIDFEKTEALLAEARDSEVLHSMELGMVDIGEPESGTDSMPEIIDCSDTGSEYDIIDLEEGISEIQLGGETEEVYARPDTPLPRSSNVPSVPMRRVVVEDYDDSDDEDENLPPLIEVSDDEDEEANVGQAYDGRSTTVQARNDDWTELLLKFLENEKGVSSEEEAEPVVLTEAELDALDAEFDAWCKNNHDLLIGKENVHFQPAPDGETPRERLWRQHRAWFDEACHTDNRLGDGAANTFMLLMEDLRSLPFPGDKKFPAHPEFEPRFGMIRVGDEMYSLYDFAQWTNPHPEITASELLSPGFSIARWYIHELADLHNEVLDPAKYDFLDSPGLPVINDPWRDNALAYLQLYEVRDARKTGREHAGHFGRWDISECSHDGWYTISDKLLQCETKIAEDLLHNAELDLGRWYDARMAERVRNANASCCVWDGVADLRILFEPEMGGLERGLDKLAESLTTAVPIEEWPVLELNGVQVLRGTYPAVERNAAVTKDHSRLIPRPLVITVNVEGHPCRALLDSGSLGDFVSSTLVTQLRLKKYELKKCLPLQLAVQGSRSKINFGCRANIQYQDVKEERYFDVINLSNYDMILGTPWIHQHKVMLGLNPPRVVIGSAPALPLAPGEAVAKLSSQAMDLLQSDVEKARSHLLDYAKLLCVPVEDTELPPLRAINHKIPLIDVNKVYSWRPSKCPEPLREQWVAKRNAYLKTGRWRITTATNASPMLLIYKPGTSLLRCVGDLRERNLNTVKVSTPMPEIEGILRSAARKPWFSTIDLAGAYEQVRVVPEHVPRTVITTPDGNMECLVMQQGDCNAPATYQALMNHIFGAYIGRFMDVYLDDIVIYSDTLKEHVEHCKLVMDVLTKEKLYLSEGKLHFLAEELKILGRIVDHTGIRMDPHKVDKILNWKAPTNRDLLRGFLGAVGYLADDAARIRIPMGILSSLTGDRVAFRWEFTHQRAFEDVKRYIQSFREHRRIPLRYGPTEPQIWVVTDGCATGVAGAVLQGNDWKKASVAAFFSAKLSAAQQNYATHEIEMLAGVETMLRHRDILQGAKFKWLTDHKGLVHLLNQKNLTGRQARWLEKLGDFNFEPVYIPGSDNVLSDALSRIYSNDAPGTMRAASEYTIHDESAVEALRGRVTEPVDWPGGRIECGVWPPGCGSSTRSGLAG